MSVDGLGADAKVPKLKAGTPVAGLVTASTGGVALTTSGRDGKTTFGGDGCCSTCLGSSSCATFCSILSSAAFFSPSPPIPTTKVTVAAGFLAASSLAAFWPTPKLKPPALLSPMAGASALLTRPVGFPNVNGNPPGFSAASSAGFPPSVGAFSCAFSGSVGATALRVTAAGGTIPLAADVATCGAVAGSSGGIG